MAVALVSPEEYLQQERASFARSEYLNGRVFAMAGGSLEHDTIAVNLAGLVYAQLRGTSCRAFSSSMKVRTRPHGLYSYPDLTVICGPPEFHDDHRDVLTNPKAVFEVLSPSTEAFDRGRKRVLYQSIDTVTDYVLISQDEPTVDWWTRQPGNLWLVMTVQGLNASLTIEPIASTLHLADLYERIAFPAA